MRKTLGLSVLLAVSLFAAGVFGLRIWRLETLSIAPPKLEPLELRRARQIYPYSIVPGGTYNAWEMAESIRHDAVIRRHYEGIEITNVRPMRLTTPMLAYVSYRKGNDVNWTDHPIHIAANELLLTDGKNLVRARCGNRVRLEKPQPLPSRVEPGDPPPPDIVFESPLPGLTPPVFAPPTPPTVQLAEALSPLVPPNSPPTIAVPPSTPPVVVPPPPGWKPPSDPPPPGWKPPSDPCCDNPPPPSPVPEPGTLALFGVGAFALAKRLWKKG